MNPATPTPQTLVVNMVDVRTQTSQAITNVAVLSGEPRHEVYSRIYARLHYHYGIDLSSFPRNKGESLLSVAERHDLIDKVYQFAQAEYDYVQAYEN